MSGTDPGPSTPEPASWSSGGDRGPEHGWRAHSRGGTWALVLVLLALLVLGVGITQAWNTGTTAPPPVSSSTASAGDRASSTPTPSATPPGARAEFDASTLGSLLLTRSDVVRALPGAADGVRSTLAPGDRAWGLPEGTVVDPAACTVALSVVEQPPAAYDAQWWRSDQVEMTQEVVVLGTQESAFDAFRTLVTEVDACPRYSLVEEPADAPTGSTPSPGPSTRPETLATWTTDPAIEGQGVYPGIVQEAVVDDGDELAQYRGYLLVGNALVAWTATALDPDVVDDAQDVLGDPVAVSSVVQDRARTAVAAQIATATPEPDGSAG